MKWFLTVIALASVVGFLAASCGPQRDFCPTTNPDPTDLNCHGNIDGSGGMGGQDQGPCDGAAQVVCSDGTRKCSFSECP
jgi:hypothetical protein